MTKDENGRADVSLEESDGNTEVPNSLKALVNHTFVFIYLQEFGYYILIGTC